MPEPREAGPFAAPMAAAETPAELPVGTPWGVVVSCIVLGIAGTFQGLTGLQVVLIARFYDWLWVFPWSLMGLGAITVAMAALYYDCRWWAGALGWASVTASLALNVVWDVMSVQMGLFSLLAWMALPAALPAVALVPFTVLTARRVAAARLALAGEPFT
jgi:hypothetical protein